MQAVVHVRASVLVAGIEDEQHRRPLLRLAEQVPQIIPSRWGGGNRGSETKLLHRDGYPELRVERGLLSTESINLAPFGCGFIPDGDCVPLAERRKPEAPVA